MINYEKITGLCRVTCYALACLSLIACQSDISADETYEGQAETNPSALVPSQSSRQDIQSNGQATYDFERQLQSCRGTICKMLPPEKMQMNQYSQKLMSFVNLSQADNLAEARQKVKGAYSGIVSMGLDTTPTPGVKLLSVQLSPGLNADLPEYDIVIRTNGSFNGAQIQDWGARIRCAPVVETTSWQTEPCD